MVTIVFVLKINHNYAVHNSAVHNSFYKLNWFITTQNLYD